jgi:CheY-like chemotaxis protein
VYGIVNTHRGYIDVQSRKGEGTSFSLYFPVQMRSFEPAREGMEGAEEAPGGKETILLIEDEEMLLNLVKELLESKGYEVLTATDGLQAMELYQQHRSRIQLVLTDIGLPKLSGWEVCRRINELDPSARVVVASGYLDPTVKSEMQNSSARDYIHKPYLPEDVLTHIRKVLDAP